MASIDMNITQITEDAILSIGKVVSVKGRTIEVRVDKTKNTSHLVYKGELLRNISVGGYLKIVKGFTRIIGKVEGEQITEDKIFGSAKGYSSERDKINRVLTVSLLGFFSGNHFERGIKELPLIDNECFILQKDEFEQVHDFIRSNDEPLTIGNLSFEKGQAIRVGVNSLFASHIGILGIRVAVNRIRSPRSTASCFSSTDTRMALKKTLGFSFWTLMANIPTQSLRPMM
jgi:hypothetical protein